MNVNHIEISFVRVGDVESWVLDTTIEFQTGEQARFHFGMGDEELDAQVSALVRAIKSHARRKFAAWTRET